MSILRLQHIVQLILIGCLLSLSIGSSNTYSAPIIKSFFPGLILTMTGENGKVFFDTKKLMQSVASIEQGPRLRTADSKFLGGFYIKNIGWASLSSGSYQVSLNCIESLSLITQPCTLMGSGWSETIGEIGFGQVRYYPDTASLSGILTTFAGNITLTGINLPLQAVDFIEDMTKLKSIHNQTLQIKNGLTHYDDTVGWMMMYSPMNNSQWTPKLGISYGVFPGVDISLADNYFINIMDPNGSMTRISNIPVTAEVPSMSLYKNTLLIEQFCNNYPSSSRCPDGSNLRPTSIDISGANKIADGKHFYDHRIIFRDRYGNAITNGTVQLYYTGTVSRVQKHPNTLTPYDTSSQNDALVFQGMTFVPDYLGQWKSFAYSLGGFTSELNYIIGSLGASDGSSRKIEFSKMAFDIPNLGPIEFHNPSFEIPLIFHPWLTTNTAPIDGTLLINQENKFKTTVTKGAPTARTDITPEIITLMTIGTGQHAAFRNFDVAGTENCQSYIQNISLYNAKCNWRRINSIVFPSQISVNTDTDVTFTGTYGSFGSYPTPEAGNYYTYLHYTENDFFGVPVDVVYPVSSNSLGLGEFSKSNVKIIGQVSAGSDYGTIITHGGTRAQFFDTLRKNISIISRNRTTYTGLNYIVHTGDITVTQASLNGRRSIITLGGDIRITENLINTTNQPIAIIALMDSTGKGGNIIIDPSVNDVLSSLFAEKSVLSSGNKQLYILGSIISANTFGDAKAQICPYHHIGACSLSDAEKYDFEEIRKGYLSIDAGDIPTHRSNQSSAIKYPTTPFIVEYDTRILRDPPPGVQ